MNIETKLNGLAFDIALTEKREVTPIFLQLYELNQYYTIEYLRDNYQKYKGFKTE